jgi:hypothetical protein
MVWVQPTSTSHKTNFRKTGQTTIKGKPRQPIQTIRFCHELYIHIQDPRKPRQPQSQLILAIQTPIPVYKDTSHNTNTSITAGNKKDITYKLIKNIYM